MISCSSSRLLGQKNILNTCHKHELFDFHRKKLEGAGNNKYANDIAEINLDPILERYYNAQWDDFDAEKEINADAV